MWKRLLRSAFNKSNIEPWYTSKELNGTKVILSKQVSFIDFYILRSSHHRCSLKKRVLRNFAKFTGKHLCQSLFFNKVAAIQSLFLPGPATLWKKRLCRRCFSMNFAKFLRTPFLQNTSGSITSHNNKTLQKSLIRNSKIYYEHLELTKPLLILHFKRYDRKGPIYLK